MNDVTIVIKTFERPDRLDRLIQSIRACYPQAVIFVADDSRKPRRPQQVDAYFEMPYDSGVSAGRNLLVKNVKTKYFLLLDDDHLFTGGTDVPGMRRILESTDIDILGGKIEKESGNWHTINVSNGVLREQRDRAKYGQLAGCLVCDKVANFMLARTARVREMGGWPEALKIGEHLPFFVAALGKLKVAYFAGWPKLPGIWGYSEQALTLASWFQGVPIHVDTKFTCLHAEYQPQGRFPFSVNRRDPAQNAHYVHAAFFPGTYAGYWRPMLEDHFGKHEVDVRPLKDKAFRELCGRIQRASIRSEEQFFREVLGRKAPQDASFLKSSSASTRMMMNTGPTTLLPRRLPLAVHGK